MNAIEFNNVSKKFKKGERFDSLRDLIPNLMKTFISGNGKNGTLHDKEFWALKDVNFVVKKGEVLGIIGSNGAGKSTVLKLLSGILKPTSGELKINGRLSALIEVGAGFHEDLTGRENIYLNGAIMGMKKWEIDKKFDAIVAFSELEEFIDTPVKRYSSGMYARLGFSVAAHLDPDILLVDEVLSVGDICLQIKCLEKIKQLKERGVTIVFISHNMEAVLGICKNVIILNKGKIMAIGNAEDVVKKYQERAHSKQDQCYDNKHNNDIIIKNVCFVDNKGREKIVFKTGEYCAIRVTFNSRRPVYDPVIGVALHNIKGVCVFGHNSKIDGCLLGTTYGECCIDLEYPNIFLQTGKYLVTIGIFDSTGEKPYDCHDRRYGFNIYNDRNAESGVISLPRAWKIKSPVLR